MVWGHGYAEVINSVSYLALGLAFVPLGYDGLKIDVIKFRFNMYTGPGYLSALLGVINIILLIIIFRDYKLTKHKQSEKMTKTVDCSDDCNSVTSNQKMPRLLAGEFSGIDVYQILCQSCLCFQPFRRNFIVLNFMLVPR